MLQGCIFKKGSIGGKCESCFFHSSLVLVLLFGFYKLLLKPFVLLPLCPLEFVLISCSPTFTASTICPIYALKASIELCLFNQSLQREPTQLFSAELPGSLATLTRKGQCWLCRLCRFVGPFASRFLLARFSRHTHTHTHMYDYVCICGSMCAALLALLAFWLFAL